MLRLAHHWIWDSWIADDGRTYHLFFLKAPRALQDPGRRHTASSIGHATSPDLVDWTVQDDALTPAENRWDDLSLWTGSVARGDDGVWRLYYTALNSGGRGVLDQRLGLAEPDDLMTRRRVGDAPLLAVDPTWYKTLDGDDTASETWRDPLVVRDPAGDGWHLFVTAPGQGIAALRRRRARPRPQRRHDDLGAGPPGVSDAGAGFGQIEVPQVRVVDGRPLLVFTCHPDEQTQRRRRASGLYCTWSVPGDSLLGPWDVERAEPFREEPVLFAAPLVQDRDGGWVFVGFRNREPEGILAFEIIDPVPVRRRGDALVRRGPA